MTLTEKTRQAIDKLNALRLSYSTHSHMSEEDITAYNYAIDDVVDMVHIALQESGGKSRSLKPRLQTLSVLISGCGDDSEWVAYSYCAGVLEKLLK